MIFFPKTKNLRVIPRSMNYVLLFCIVLTFTAFYLVYPSLKGLMIFQATNNSHAQNIFESHSKRNETLEGSRSLNLGLDLSGGIHLLLEVDFESYLNDKYQDLTHSIKQIIRKNAFGYTGLKFSSKGIELVLNDLTKRSGSGVNSLNSSLGSLNSTNKDSLQNKDATKTENSKLVRTKGIDAILLEIKNSDGNLNITQSENNQKITISYSETYLNETMIKLIDQSIKTLRSRVDNTGTKEPVIHRQGFNKIVLEMPGLTSADTLKNSIGKTAKLTFHLVEGGYGSNNVSEKLPSDFKALSLKSSAYKLVIKSRPELTGDMLEQANVSFDEYSRPNIAFKLNSKGAKIFSEVTSNNIGKGLAIVLDDIILTAPSINTQIKEGSGVITGNFTIEEANELVNFLKSGSLSAKLTIIEEKVIGPTLGEKSIQDTKLAGITALLLIICFMVSYYKLFGVFASISLILSVVYIFAMLTAFKATLTMPGIAGIILTIGIAVDANILIFERIKEELKENNSVRHSIKMGFKFALNTIIDSNITTLIVAALLYVYGTGPIRGFAVTLTIGIIASMFSAIVVTKLMIDFWMRFGKNTDKKYLI